MPSRPEVVDGPLSRKRVQYQQLNGKQKENFNFAKLSAVLADHGYVTLRLSDDWKGADLIAVHHDGSDVRVQLKGRLTVDKKYLGKRLYIAFHHSGCWYVYPHDRFLHCALGRIERSASWVKSGHYSWPSVPDWATEWLADYGLEASTGLSENA